MGSAAPGIGRCCLFAKLIPDEVAVTDEQFKELKGGAACSDHSVGIDSSQCGGADSATGHRRSASFGSRARVSETSADSDRVAS